MRLETILTNQDASVDIVSVPYVIGCGQDMRWLLTITTENTDGNIKLFIEESPDNTVWIPLQNLGCDEILDYFLIDDSPYSIRDSYFMGKSIRLRIEANDNTTGTVSASLVVKTKSN